MNSSASVGFRPAAMKDSTRYGISFSESARPSRALASLSTARGFNEPRMGRLMSGDG